MSGRKIQTTILLRLALASFELSLSGLAERLPHLNRQCLTPIFPALLLKLRRI